MTFCSPLWLSKARQYVCTCVQHAHAVKSPLLENKKRDCGYQAQGMARQGYLLPPVSTKMDSFIPLFLCFPHLLFSKLPKAPPFLTFGSSLKYPIINPEQSQAALSLYPMCPTCPTLLGSNLPLVWKMNQRAAPSDSGWWAPRLDTETDALLGQFREGGHSLGVCNLGSLPAAAYLCSSGLLEMGFWWASGSWDVPGSSWCRLLSYFFYHYSCAFIGCADELFVT